MKAIIILTLLTTQLLLAQKLKLGDTEKVIEFSHTPKKISLELQSGLHKEMIWSKPITYGSDSDDYEFNSTVYPNTNNSRVNPYEGATIIQADFKDLGNDSSLCLVLIELDYKNFSFIAGETWLGPSLPKNFGEHSHRGITLLGDVYGKKNYLLRSFIKNEGKWQPYLSCYLESIWYDLIGVPIDQIRIESKNSYAVVYKHGRKLVKYNNGEKYPPQPTLEELFGNVDDIDAKVAARGHLREDLLVNTKEPVTRELVYNDQVGFLQVNDSGKLKYAVQAVWWKGFDEFTYFAHGFEENKPYLSEKVRIMIENARKRNYYTVQQAQKDLLPDAAIKYEPTVKKVADKYMQTLFDIVKFRKEKGRKPFTKEEIIRLADAKFKDENDPYYKDFIESKLSNPLHQNWFFYEE